MRCPFCNEENTRVIDTRSMESNSVIKRRRQCDKCGRRFTTYERVELIPFMVIKKDESREPYSRSKIETGIVNACHKRPVSRAQIVQIVDKIENAVINCEDREIRTSLIGELVMEQLKEIDEVAYVRFASVYREFRDVNTFLEELEKLYKR